MSGWDLSRQIVNAIFNDDIQTVQSKYTSRRFEKSFQVQFLWSAVRHGNLEIFDFFYKDIELKDSAWTITRARTLPIFDKIYTNPFLNSSMLNQALANSASSEETRPIFDILLEDRRITLKGIVNAFRSAVRNDNKSVFYQLFLDSRIMSNFENRHTRNAFNRAFQDSVRNTDDTIWNILSPFLTPLGLCRALNHALHQKHLGARCDEFIQRFVGDPRLNLKLIDQVHISTVEHLRS
jgi:hypothetical protein